MKMAMTIMMRVMAIMMRVITRVKKLDEDVRVFNW